MGLPVRKSTLLYVLLTLAVGATYLASPVIESEDGRLVVYESNSIIRAGNIDLSKYGGAVDGFPCYRVGPRTLSRYPWGTAVMTVPALLAIELAAGLTGTDVVGDLGSQLPHQLEKTLASVMATLAVVLLAVLTQQLTGRRRPALLAGVVFALATSLWSTVSRGLWQHGPLIVLTTIGLILLARARARGDRRLAAVSSLPFAAAFAVRPTAAIPLTVFFVLVVSMNRKAASAYGLMAVVVLVPILVINRHLYGTWLNPFYFHNGASFLGSGLKHSFPTALAATMVSPARGLLVYSPFVGLAPLGLVWRRHGAKALEACCALVVLGLWLVVSNTVDWPGGYSYGPRLLADALPFLAVMLAPVFDRVTTTPTVRGWRQRVVVVLLTVGTVWGGAVNGRGALSWAPQLWNVYPVPSSYERPGRFWDWSDAPFLRRGHVSMRDLYGAGTTPRPPPHEACLRDR